MFDTDTMTKREIEIAEYYKEQGLKHSEMSPKTREEFKSTLNKLEEKYVKKDDCSSNNKLCKAVNIDPLMKDVAEIKINQKEQGEDIKVLKEGQAKLLLEFTKMPELLVEKIDKRYADKKTVDDLKGNVTWLTRLIIGAVVLGVLGLLFTK